MSYGDKPVEGWTESDVSEWLTSIGLKNEYITKLYEEEATGAVLRILSEQDLTRMGMKYLQIQLLLRKRDELFTAQKEIPKKLESKPDQTIGGFLTLSANIPISAKHNTNDGHGDKNPDISLDNPTKNIGQACKTFPHNDSSKSHGKAVPINTNKHLEKQPEKCPNLEERTEEILNENPGSNVTPGQSKESQAGTTEEKTPNPENSTSPNLQANKSDKSTSEPCPATDNSLPNKQKLQNSKKGSQPELAKKSEVNPQQNVSSPTSAPETINSEHGEHGEPKDGQENLATEKVPIGQLSQKKNNKKSKKSQKNTNQNQKDKQRLEKVSGGCSEDKHHQNQSRAGSQPQNPLEKDGSTEKKHTATNVQDDQEQQKKSIGTSKEHQQTMSPEGKTPNVTETSERNIGTKDNSSPVQKNNKKAFLTPSNFRPFDEHDRNFKYVKNQVLSPENGITNLISPCHEYKSFAIAADLDKPRLLAKLRYETFRFAAACLNMRTNGTIHFGIMDSVEDQGYTHGQIVGVPIINKDWYADVLNDLDKCFPEASEHAAAAMCIRCPDFVEVIDVESDEKRFVVEVDIEPLSITVEGKLFQVSLPKFDSHKNKTFYERKTIYERRGAQSQSVKIEEEVNALILRIKEADKRRKEAEKANVPQEHRHEHLGRKLSVLITNGKQYFDDTLQYVLVTNKCEPHQLQHLTFLKYLKILCVFDFDAESDISGLHSKCKEYHLTDSYSLQRYASEYGKNLDDIINHLGLFKHTSWIFCNGRKSYHGEDPSCDEHSWIKEKMTHFKKAVSLICDNIKRGCFIVLFMLFSPGEKPIVKAFHEFYEELRGMDYITCITDSAEYYEQWAGLAETTCNRTELDQRSIVGMKLSHVDATVQDMIPEKDFNRKLPVSTKGVCILTKPKEEKMNSLDILCVNQCENNNHKAIDPKKLESDFYRGGQITWKLLWLAEQKKCGAFIERYACQEVENMLNGILNENTVKLPVAQVHIFHQPGSGGSTVARQILWKKRKDLRCAIVNSRYHTAKVCEDAVQLREYEERDKTNCLPVLLLLEDCSEEYIDEIKNILQEAMIHKKVRRAKTCFIFLTCKRSKNPELSCAASSSDTVSITHSLRDNEKLLFKSKAEELHESFPSQDLIITFVLMSQEFKPEYLENFVKNVMKDLDHSSPVTRLIRYVALLNHYVQNSYISLSHCEVLLGIQSYVSLDYKLSQNRDLNSLREQALIIELRDETTYISAIRILHPLIAQELLHQYSTQSYPQSKIALELLDETAALNHRFAREEFIKFIKHLFFRRHRRSRGDEMDSLFSPLIEHVCDKENDTEMAIRLLYVAYEQLDKDAHFAQQLARLHYSKLKFEEAKKWVGIAKAKLPDDSYILDTEGRLYEKWFTDNYDKFKENSNSIDDIDLIELGLKSMECFRTAQRAANNEKDTINNSGYFGEVNIGCSLLELLLRLFKNIKKDKADLVKYLTNVKYIPEEIKQPWANLHGLLKNLYENMYNALEWISEDVGCFMSDKRDVWDQTARKGDNVRDQTARKNDPDRKWLVKKTQIFAQYFCSEPHESYSASGKQSPFARKMAIFSAGGSSVATILSFLSNSNRENSVSALEGIISCYPKDISEDKLDDSELISFIMCQIALGSIKPDSPKLYDFKKLLLMSQRFLNERKMFLASAYFLIFLLYWPDGKFITQQHANRSNILTSAVEAAERLRQKKLKYVPVRKKRTNVLFFLGKAHGLEKFIFRGDIERLLNHPLNERTFRFDSDPKDRELIQDKLKKVEGWTQNGKVYTKGAFGKEKIEVLPLNYSSVPHGDENVTFYLGFTYIGYVTYGIEVKQHT